jgi:hypothetical protein
MTQHNFDSEMNVDKIIQAAKAAGFQVTRSQSKGRLSLNITRTPGLYEYIAHFRRKDSTGVFTWDFAQHIVDGEDARIFTMERFIERLSNAVSSS